MHRTFSIATLLLVMTIAAVGLASLRGISQHDVGGASLDARAQVIISALGGAVFGFALAGWNGAAPIWRLGGWARILIGIVCGAFLGAAAAAQSVTRVDGIVLLLIPIVVVGGAALFVVVQRMSGRTRPADHEIGA